MPVRVTFANIRLSAAPAPLCRPAATRRSCRAPPPGRQRPRVRRAAAACRDRLAPGMAQHCGELGQPRLVIVRAEDELRDPGHRRARLHNDPGIGEQRLIAFGILLGRQREVVRPAKRPVQRRAAARVGGAHGRRTLARDRQPIVERIGRGHVLDRRAQVVRVLDRAHGVTAEAAGQGGEVRRRVAQAHADPGDRPDGRIRPRRQLHGRLPTREGHGPIEVAERRHGLTPSGQAGLPPRRLSPKLPSLGIGARAPTGSSRSRSPRASRRPGRP